MDFARFAGRLRDAADGTIRADGPRRDLTRRPSFLDQARERARSARRSQSRSFAGEETKDSLADQGRFRSLAAIPRASGLGDRRGFEEGRDCGRTNASHSDARLNLVGCNKRSAWRRPLARLALCPKRVWPAPDKMLRLLQPCLHLVCRVFSPTPRAAPSLPRSYGTARSAGAWSRPRLHRANARTGTAAPRLSN